jgi:hypothetical protein
MRNLALATPLRGWEDCHPWSVSFFLYSVLWHFAVRTFSLANGDRAGVQRASRAPSKQRGIVLPIPVNTDRLSFGCQTSPEGRSVHLGDCLIVRETRATAPSTSASSSVQCP